MIILESVQLPKLQQAHVPPQPPHNNDDGVPFRRPASALSAVTLPDYEASQKAYVSPRPSPLPPTRLRFYPLSPFRRSSHPPSRSRRIVLFVYYIFLAYAIIGSIVLVPVLLWKAREQKENEQYNQGFNFFQETPPSWSIPLYDSSRINMALMASGSGTFACNKWTPGPTTHVDQTTTYRASLNYSFDIPPSLRLTSDNGAQGTLLVDLNPDKSTSEVVFKADVQYTNPAFFHNSSLCFTRADNLTVVALQTPDVNPQHDTLTANLTILFPHKSRQTQIPEFATYIPNFEQHIARISPSVMFTNVALEGSHGPISFESIIAETLVVKTSSAAVTGNMNITGALSIDTVSAPIDANVSLVNYAESTYPSSATLATGNSPLNVNFIVAAAGTPKRAQFLFKANTFNAPLNMTVSHAPGSPAALMYIHGITAAGPLTMSADTLYSGTFDLSTKDASADVRHAFFNSSSNPTSSKPGSSSNNNSTGCTVQYDYKTSSLALGWAGNGKRPSSGSGSGSGGQSQMVLENSLGDVTLNLWDSRGVPGVVSWAGLNLQ